MKKDEMVKKNSDLPAFIKTGSVEGTEHITKDDLQMPRLALAQSMSPQCQEGGPKHVDGLKMGMMFNNLTEEIYGKGPIEFIIVRADKPRGIEFNPIEDGGGIKDFDVPVDDPRMKFGPDGQKPTATKFYDYVVVLYPSMEVIALSFKGTGLKVARTLNGLIKLRRLPIYAGKYQLSTAIETNKMGTYAVFAVKNAGHVPDEETYNFCEAVYQDIKDKVITIERTDEDADDFVDATGETRF